MTEKHKASSLISFLPLIIFLIAPNEGKIIANQQEQNIKQIAQSSITQNTSNENSVSYDEPQVLNTYLEDYNMVNYDISNNTITYENFDMNSYPIRSISAEADVSIGELDQEEILGTGMLSARRYVPETMSYHVSTLNNAMDGEDWIEITNPRVWPYFGVAYIQSEWGGATGQGTGFMMGPDLLVTSAHCVYPWFNGNPRFLSSLKVWAAAGPSGWRANNEYYAEAEIVSIDREFYENPHQNVSHDWCAVKLDRPLGYQTGWYGKIAGWYEGNAEVYSYGYPSGSGAIMQETRGELIGWQGNNSVYEYTLDTMVGQSGSPVFMTASNGNSYVCGIHSSAGQLPHFNRGTVISPFIFHYLNSFVTGHNYERFVGTIEPIDYGFADAYPTDSATQNNFITHTVDGLTFQTRRYRTGFIHDEYIVMSPIKTGITEAFIEYQFSELVGRIDVQLSHWREYSNEWLNSDSGTAELQILNSSNQWTQEFDLLSDTTALPRNRQIPTTYKINFSRPVYNFRFYAKINNPTSSASNRGRVCIGDLNIFPAYMPTSGSEIIYDPSSWNNNSSILSNSNCYSYALNARRNVNGSMSFMQPGQSVGGISSYDDITDTSRLLNFIQLDAINYGFTFKAIGKYSECPIGTYKVALVVDPNDYSGSSYVDIDYHWYRQNPDGTWSHKPGNTAVRNTDYSNNIIIDPETCNRKYDNSLNYTRFVGFFMISPLNTVY
jgi:V8-like Glu-specific endopeptidase